MKRISADSREYLLVPIQAKVGGVSIDPTGDAVDLAIIASGATVKDADFSTGDWEPGTQNARLLIGPSSTFGSLTAGFYNVYARVHASPELPVVSCGTIQIF